MGDLGTKVHVFINRNNYDLDLFRVTPLIKNHYNQEHTLKQSHIVQGFQSVVRSILFSIKLVSYVSLRTDCCVATHNKMWDRQLINPTFGKTK